MACPRPNEQTNSFHTDDALQKVKQEGASRVELVAGFNVKVLFIKSESSFRDKSSPRSARVA